jgi:hypothetical protein
MQHIPPLRDAVLAQKQTYAMQQAMSAKSQKRTTGSPVTNQSPVRSLAGVN